MEPGEEIHERRFARPGGADDRHRLPGGNARRDVGQHRDAVVAEREVAELDLAPDPRARMPRRGPLVPNRRLGVEHLQHALPGRHAALQQVGDPAEGNHRPRQHRQVPVERDQVAERDAAVDDRDAPQPEHQQRRDAEKEPDAGEKQTLQPNQRLVAADVLVVGGGEPCDLRGLLPVGADHAHARQRLLDDGAHLGQLRLDPLESLVNGAAEQPHQHRDERQRDQRHGGQPWVDAHHQDDREQERDDRAGRIHDGGADHHPHGV